MKISLSKREKILIFILGFLIVVSLAYTFFFNAQLEKWSVQKEIYDSVESMVAAINQSDEELKDREKYIEELKVEAEKLAVGYYLDYTNHMAEEKITSMLSQQGLNPSYVSVESSGNQPLLPFGANGESSLSVNASRITISFYISGSLDNLILLLTKIDSDPGLLLSNFSLSGSQEGIYYMNVMVEMLLGSTQGVLDE